MPKRKPIPDLMAALKESLRPTPEPAGASDIEGLLKWFEDRAANYDAKAEHNARYPQITDAQGTPLFEAQRDAAAKFRAAATSLRSSRETSRLLEAALDAETGRANRAEEARLRAEAALQEINAIRNSIVGTQSINWSAHIYPLVEVLDKAGIKGQECKVARAEAVTLIQQRDRAEAERDEARQLAEEYCDKYGAANARWDSLQAEIEKLDGRDGVGGLMLAPATWIKRRSVLAAIRRASPSLQTSPHDQS